MKRQRTLVTPCGSRQLAATLVIGVAAGCSNGGAARRMNTQAADGGPMGPASMNDAASARGHCETLNQAALTGSIEDLFAFTHVPSIDLSLPEADWQKLQLNARDEEYVEAEACFEGGSLGKVGLRFKGSYGTLYSCFDEAGENTCRKLALKLKFDQYDPEQRFYGLKRLNFQSNRYDDSYLKEKLAYDLYRAMGIVGPHAGWATVRVNGELQGLFGMVEEVDGRLTADRWPADGDGNLYKELWPVETDPERVAEHLETNKEQAETTAFVGFAQAMNAATDDERRSTLGQFTDLEYLARYMAVDDAILNVDGVTAFYVDPSGGGSNHNFYIYESTDGRFTLVPWDLDSTFDTISFFGSVPSWKDVPADCSQSYPVWGGDGHVVAPGCDVVFRAIASDLTSYLAAGQELLAGPFSQEALLAAIEQHQSFIRDAAVADPNGPGRARWESAVDELRRRVPGLRRRFERMLAGQPWVPLVLDTTQTTTFEALDELELTSGVLWLANPSSTVSVELETDEPIVGDQSAVMSFEYRNEELPWEQWSLLDIRLASGQGNLTQLTGIRLWVRTDQPRVLRLSVNSPRSTAAEVGILFGWDVPLTAEAKQIEVLFTEMAMPAWAIMQGSAPDDDPADILQAVTGLRFFPNPAGRGAGGQFAEGATDPGFLIIDQVEFF